jgi:Fe-S-cluster containining protein
MRKKYCPFCEGGGLVCAVHRDRPWLHENGEDCGEGGVECVCSPRGGILPIDFAEVEFQPEAHRGMRDPNR